MPLYDPSELFYDPLRTLSNLQYLMGLHWSTLIHCGLSLGPLVLCISLHPFRSLKTYKVLLGPNRSPLDWLGSLGPSDQSSNQLESLWTYFKPQDTITPIFYPPGPFKTSKDSFRYSWTTLNPTISLPLATVELSRIHCIA